MPSAQEGCYPDLQMNAYVRLSETSEDPTPDKHRLFSLDVNSGNLAFVAALKDARFIDHHLDVASIVLLPNHQLLGVAPERHFATVDEFVEFVGGVVLVPQEASV